MTEHSARPRIRIHWSPEARSDVRAIDRATAGQILDCLDRYAKTHAGDAKKLRPPLSGFRLRCGDYRLFYRQVDESSILITAVRHRSEAYR